jgi:hypothetical protein
VAAPAPRVRRVSSKDIVIVLAVLLALSAPAEDLASRPVAMQRHLVIRP